jgi:hypothetical protein
MVFNEWCEGKGGYMSYDAGVLVFPAPKELVFKCALRAVGTTKFRLESEDPFLGRILLKSGVTLTSWGESINIDIISRGANESTVSIESDSFSDTSRNSKNIAILFNAIRNEVVSELERNPIEINDAVFTDSSTGKSAKDRIKELQDLLDDGLISRDDFEERKTKILNDI